MTGKSSQYWDSSLWIAMLTNEATRQPGEMEGLRELVKDAETGKSTIVVSTIVRIEVLKGKLNPEQYAQFKSTLDLSYITEVAVDANIAEIASEIRVYYANDKEEGSKMKLPDAIHLATAIAMEVDCFYHFEGKEKPTSFGRIVAPVANKYDLKIKKPSRQQLAFPLSQ